MRALWSSPFRPFYLLGAAYGPLVMLAGSAAWLRGGAEPLLLRLWHGHEMVFGFSGAIITGIVLTALPSWAGTPEIRGRPLALLVALWLAGRAAAWLAPALPPGLVALADLPLFAAVAVLVTPQLLRVPNRWYLLLLPVLAGLFAGNALYHWGAARGDAALAASGLRLGVHAIVLLYVLKGGVLTPIFTGNALREKRRGGEIPFVFALDAAAVVSVLAFAAADLSGASWSGAAAALACAIHALRLARWRGWRLADTPLVLVMHLGYAFLVLALGLAAASALGGPVPADAWLHAFTVGSLGLMMLGLMTRVVLRHTGRPLAPPGAIVAGYWAMLAAALLRLVASVLGLPPALLAAASLLWVAPFVVYLALFGALLWRPSLPRAAP